MSKQMLRWSNAVKGLAVRLERSEITQTQYDVFIELMARIWRDVPGVRYPSFGMHENDIHISWTYADIRRASFTIDIDPIGQMSWFFGYDDGHDGGDCAELTNDTIRLLWFFADEPKPLQCCTCGGER